MFRTAIGRLLWKEYRVQRALWFLLLGILLLLQVLLRLAYFNSTESITHAVSIDEQWATRTMWLLVFVMQVIFIVASVAISFAGEREERTCDFLVHHAPSPWAILSAKIGICFAGSAGLYVCGAFMALILGRSHSIESNLTYQLVFFHNSMAVDFTLRLTILLVLLAWCVFGSLLSQRVITSIPTMAVGWIATGWLPMVAALTLMNLIPGQIEMRFERTIMIIVFALGAIAMIGFDAWLGYRWAEGRFVDLRFLTEYGDFWSTTWLGIRNRSSRPSRIPSSTEPEESERRAWLRLVWQERNRNVIPRWMVISIVAFVLLSSDADYVVRENYGIPLLQDFVVCLIGLVMGILSFRNEGEGQPVRFMANHGSSPKMIWNARQSVWLFRAIVTPAVLLAIMAIRDQRFLSYPHALIERHFWLVLMSYGSGQLAAMLLHRAMLAAITGGMLAAVLFLWFELMRSLHIPQFWSAGVPIVALIVATRMHARSWLLDYSTRDHKLRLASVLMGLPFLPFAIVAIYRVYEVDRINPAQLSRKVFESARRLPFMFDTSNLSVDTTTSAMSTVRKRLQDIAARPTTSVAVPGTANLTLSVDDRTIADELAVAFASDAFAIHFESRSESSGRFELFPAVSFSRLSDRMLARARDHMALNEPTAAFRMCQTHLNACRTMARGPFNSCWKPAAVEERRALELLVEWANRADVPFADIHGAIKELEERQNRFPAPGAAIVDELTLAKRNSIVERYIAHHGSILGWQRIWMQLPWEAARRNRLWEIEAELHRAHLACLFAQLSFDQRLSPEADLIPVGGNYLESMSELQSTTWGAEIALAGDRSEFVRDRFTAMRAAMTRMGIIAYRKQYGSMPADLDSLFGIVLQRNFQDPWSNGRFDYRTNCLVSQGDSPRATDIQTQESVSRQPVTPSRFVFPIPSIAVDRD